VVVLKRLQLRYLTAAGRAVGSDVPGLSAAEQQAPRRRPGRQRSPCKMGPRRGHRVRGRHASPTRARPAGGEPARSLVRLAGRPRKWPRPQAVVRCARARRRGCHPSRRRRSQPASARAALVMTPPARWGGTAALHTNTALPARRSMPNLLRRLATGAPPGRTLMSLLPASLGPLHGLAPKAPRPSSHDTCLFTTLHNRQMGSRGSHRSGGALGVRRSSLARPLSQSSHVGVRHRHGAWQVRRMQPPHRKTCQPDRVRAKGCVVCLRCVARRRRRHGMRRGQSRVSRRCCSPGLRGTRGPGVSRQESAAPGPAGARAAAGAACHCPLRVARARREFLPRLEPPGRCCGGV
jgi:hypothetical protein